MDIDLNPDYEYSLNGAVTQGQESLSTAGFYILDAIDPTTLCVNSTFFELTLLDLPSLDLPEEVALCEGEVYELNLPNINQFHWFEDELVTEVDFREGGTYEILAENDCGETSGQVTVVEQVCDCDWYVPNAFTPNLDDINEGVGVTAECDFSKFSWRVYNRWGELVFEGTSPDQWWFGEGMAGTHYSPDGMYQWILEVELQFADGVEARTATGTVVLLR
ncbi:MAG: gliding motility-associated C-terminal domain-containing protein [Bacteroidota bacterium]